MSSDQSDNEAPLEISMKSKTKPKNRQIIKAKHHNIKKSSKSNSVNEMKKKLRKELKQKIQEEKMLQELKKMPVSLGERRSKVIKIDDTVVQRKKINRMGLELVQKSRREIRKPEQRYELQLDASNRLRGDFAQILAFKKSKA